MQMNLAQFIATQRDPDAEPCKAPVWPHMRPDGRQWNVDIGKPPEEPVPIGHGINAAVRAVLAEAEGPMSVADVRVEIGDRYSTQSIDLALRQNQNCFQRVERGKFVITDHGRRLHEKEMNRSANVGGADS